MGTRIDEMPATGVPQGIAATSLPHWGFLFPVI